MNTPAPQGELGSPLNDRSCARPSVDDTRRPVAKSHLLAKVAATPFIPKWFMGLLTLGLCGGCAAYRLGPDSMFHPGVQTVYLPIARNDTFRHDLGVRLTEAVKTEIQRRTPYTVTGDPNADSTLSVRVVSEAKRVLTETDSDDPRALDAAISVRATWTSRSGQLLMQNSVVPTGDLAIRFGQNSRFVPEAGQSIDSATQAAIENLAERIVSQMEIRW